MAIVITDPNLLTQLVQAFNPVEIRDANGNLLGTFAPPAGKMPPGLTSPFSDEEIERKAQTTRWPTLGRYSPRP